VLYRSIIVLVIFVSPVLAEDWKFKQQLLPVLADKIPGILKTQDPQTGRFGTGVFIVRDQEVMYPLAVAWATKGEGNPHYHSEELLRAIIKGGDALIDEQKPTGMWIFRKKDKSEWGDIYMPWTYSRWIRAYSLIKGAMPDDARQRWEKALILGYSGIVKTELTKGVQNIPAHHAMGTYLAGKTFNKPEWCDAAKAYMKKVADEQAADGFWTEHVGPVIIYGFVYVEAIGTYYGMSHDPDVLPALQRAARFHSAFVYPDGRPVEVVDERNPYEASSILPNVGFTFSNEGRSWAKLRMDERLKTGNIGADMLASYIMYGEEGAVQPVEKQSQQTFVTTDRNAMTVRDAPWFACLTSYRADLIDKRWIQDRQNFFSLFHDDHHVIIGGGNTKLQPLWSTFTVGDVSLLNHTPGDENPKFLPPPGLLHTPTEANLDPANRKVELTYVDVKCAAWLDVSDAKVAKVTYALLTPTDKPVEAHVTMVPAMKAKWRTASGKSGTLSEEPMTLAAGEAGEWFQLGGWRVSVPPQATLTWPVLPHNPYTKDGHAEPREGRIVMTLPLTRQVLKYELTVQGKTDRD
jgi:hypothetical protein